MDRNDEKLSRKSERSVKNTTTPPPGSLRMVLKHSDGLDIMLMTLGTIGCVADGASMSSIMLVLSNLMNGYASSYLTLQEINKYALDLLYVAVGVGSGAFLGVLTEKVPNFIMNIAMFMTAQMTAVYLCWRLAIVAIPAVLMLIIPGLVYGKLLTDVGEKIQEAYTVAGGIAEQALSSIRTVYSYVREDHTAQSYSDALEPILNLGSKQGLMKGMAIGSVGIAYAVWALQGWYGSILVTEKGVKGGNAFTAGVCIVYGGL
ncbi:hypothetical protein Acr_23g0003580 [Actinidia rufa]|uniref:ABC transmembrane type-1 domain-containing protein n=1 Tax=Actinidia rufa TaxID=165716 RepID=A0A7J0GMF2_9ERIC|nr:hypothetical protein Acr_23g0003580 [Actinidia rufa]